MADQSATPTTTILYLAPDLSDPAVARRRAMLETGGGRLTLAGFVRGQAPPPPEDWAAEVLGRTHDADLGQRALAVLGHLLRPRSLWHRVRGQNVVIARNLEMLALAWAGLVLSRSRARLCYEVLDIHRIMLGAGLKSRILRTIERILLKRVDLLILSSPGFDRAYFSKLQPTSAARLLLENKVLILEGPSPEAHPTPKGPPWRIGWFGMLRCQKSLDILARLASEMPGRIEVDIRGRPSPAVFGDTFAETVENLPGLTFHGPYRSQDLASAYDCVHLVWAIDFYEEGLNSDWLLPNRLYEGSAYGRPLLAQRNVETGLWLERHSTGALFADLEAELRPFFEALTQQHLQALSQGVASIPRRELICEVSDCRQLVEQLAGDHG